MRKKFYTKLRSKYYLSVQPERTGGEKKNPNLKMTLTAHIIELSGAQNRGVESNEYCTY